MNGTDRRALHQAVKREDDKKWTRRREDALQEKLDAVTAERDALTAKLNDPKFMRVPAAEFQDLDYWLDRCHSKGHMEQCSDLIEPYEEFCRAAFAATK